MVRSMSVHCIGIGGRLYSRGGMMMMVPSNDGLNRPRSEMALINYLLQNNEINLFVVIIKDENQRNKFP